MIWWWIVGILIAAFLVRLVIFTRDEMKANKDIMYFEQITSLIQRFGKASPFSPIRAVELLHILVETRSLTPPSDYREAHEAVIYWFESELAVAEFLIKVPKEIIDTPQGQKEMIGLADTEQLMRLEHRSHAAGDRVRRIMESRSDKNYTPKTGIKATRIYAFFFGRPS